MFGDLFGNLQKQQEELQQKLSMILVNAESGDGAVKVEAGADMRIGNIKIDTAKLDLNDAEQLEDLLLVAVNRALELARERAAAESAKLLEGFLPPGGMDQFLTP